MMWRLENEHFTVLALECWDAEPNAGRTEQSAAEFFGWKALKRIAIINMLGILRCIADGCSQAAERSIGKGWEDFMPSVNIEVT